MAPKIAMLSSANLNVVDRKVLARSTDTKPNAADGMDKWVGLSNVDLAADASDINIDDVGHGIEMKIPYVLQQHRPRDNLALVANQVFEKLKFSWQQVNFSARAAHRSRHQVELEITDAQHHVFDDAIAPPGESLNTGKQFREGKRLDEVVVATGAQAAHPIFNFAKSAD